MQNIAARITANTVLKLNNGANTETSSFERLMTYVMPATAYRTPAIITLDHCVGRGHDLLLRKGQLVVKPKNSTGIKNPRFALRCLFTSFITIISRP